MGFGFYTDPMRLCYGIQMKVLIELNTEIGKRAQTPALQEWILTSSRTIASNTIIFHMVYWSYKHRLDFGKHEERCYPTRSTHCGCRKD